LFCTIFPPDRICAATTKRLAGASWIAEYGDPDKPGRMGLAADLFRLSTAAKTRAEISPPILIAHHAARRPRSTPGHARQDGRPSCRPMGYEAYLYRAPRPAGHGYGKDNKETGRVHSARLTAFLKKQDRLDRRSGVGFVFPNHGRASPWPHGSRRREGALLTMRGLRPHPEEARTRPVSKDEATTHWAGVFFWDLWRAFKSVCRRPKTSKIRFIGGHLRRFSQKYQASVFAASLFQSLRYRARPISGLPSRRARVETRAFA